MRFRLLAALLLGLSLLAACESPGDRYRPTVPVSELAPRVTRFDAEPMKILGKDQFITFTAEASDRQGKPLTYAWTASKGTLSATTGTTVTWTPYRDDGHFTPGIAQVTVTVSNGEYEDHGTANIDILEDGTASIIPPGSIPTVVITPTPRPSATPSGQPAPSATPASPGPGLVVGVYRLPAGTDQLPASLGTTPPYATFVAPAVDVAGQTVEGYQGPEGPVSEWFALQYTGKLEAPAAGKYQFELASAGARLMVGDQLVIDASTARRLERREGVVQLEQGPHAVKLVALHRRGAMTLQLLWAPPGQPQAVVPASAFSHD